MRPLGPEVRFFLTLNSIARAEQMADAIADQKGEFFYEF
jgi:hypothetical protein